jgi:hypothetical protein
MVLFVFVPTAGELISLIVPIGILFLVFKAGQRYGQAKERRNAAKS